MKRIQEYTFHCLLAAGILFQCGHPVPGGDCVYKEIPGYISINRIDTAMSKGLAMNYYYVWCRFISSDFSDTIRDCRTIINIGCLTNKIITFDSLISCTWEKKISGGCAPGPIKIISIPDTCYAGYPFL